MIDPQDIDPDTGRPYANYSSPSLDTSAHDHEMDVDEPKLTVEQANDLIRPLREAGFAVVIFTPEELGKVAPKILEEVMISLGNTNLQVERALNDGTGA